MYKGTFFNTHYFSFIYRDLVLRIIFLSVFAALLGPYLLSSTAKAASPVESLPLISKNHFSYTGGFRIPQAEVGVSRIGYAEGIMTLGADGKSIFIVGHTAHQAIGEFSIPTLVNSDNLNELNFASNIQPFSTVLGRAENGNTQNIDRIGGMEYIDGKLLVNTYMYYDAANTVKHTTLAIDDSSNLNTSLIKGYYQYQALIHASGWISAVPETLQTTLGGSYITGQSSGIPIISRLSVGPSAFAFDPLKDIFNASPNTPVPTVKLLDFSLRNILGVPDTGEGYWESLEINEKVLMNENRDNDLWTHLSRAVYGFIVPGTRSYVTVGYSGAHDSGIGYKITQDNGVVCGGYCSYAAEDNYTYYWLWDLNDLLAVKNGTKESFDIMPYEYGIFDTPFQSTEIRGASFDSQTSTLYLVLNAADLEQNVYEPQPLVVAYKLSAPLSPSPPSPPSRLVISVQAVSTSPR